MANTALTRLSIIVVGGGIGGLAAAVLLAQSGHHVVILERRDSDLKGQSTGGIALTHNSIRIFERMGLKDDLEAIGDRAYPTRMKYDTLEVVARDESTHPHYMVHRADVSKMLLQRVQQLEVKIHLTARITAIQESHEQVTVKLSDGRAFRSDLLIGADGINSQVRQTILPEMSPHITPCTVMLVNIPESTMRSNPGTSRLYDMPAFHSPWGPGQSIVSWTMTGRQVYHLQMCDYIYGNGEAYNFHDPPEAPYIVELDDEKSLKALQNHWADWDPRIQFICKSATSYTKWKIAELPELPSYASASRRIVLLGDAAHAVKPFAGQGANMAIEDGQTLDTLLSLMTSKCEIPDAISIYDQVRIPRLSKLRKIIELNVRIFGMKDAELTQSAIHDLGQVKKEELERKMEEEAAKRAQEMKEYGPKAARDWLFGYEAETEARNAWTEFKSRVEAETDAKL